MKNMGKKVLVLCLIFLFIGVSVSSAVSVNTKSTIVNKQIEDDCGCEEISDTDLFKVEMLLNKVEVYSKLLLVLSRDNSELLEIDEEFFDILNIYKQWDNPIICGGLFVIMFTVVYWAFDINKSAEVYPEGSLMRSIYTTFFYIFVRISYKILSVAKSFNCKWSENIEPKYITKIISQNHFVGVEN